MIHFLTLQRVGLSDFDQNDETAIIYFGTRDKYIVNVKEGKEKKKEEVTLMGLEKNLATISYNCSRLLNLII